MSESLTVKADRYLVEGRVKVVTLSGDHGRFTVIGSGDEPYQVWYNGDWMCNCPARVMVCAHVLACQKIVSFGERPRPKFSNDSELTQLLGLRED